MTFLNIYVLTEFMAKIVEHGNLAQSYSDKARHTNQETEISAVYGERHNSLAAFQTIEIMIKKQWD